MKKTSVVCLILASLLVIFNHAANYWLGYSETEVAFLAIDPIIGLFLEFAIFAYLFFVVILSLFVKPRSRWPLYSLVAFWPSVILTWYCLGLPGPLIARGLRDRVVHDYTLDDLRRFAREVDQAGLLKHGDWIKYGGSLELTGQQKEAFARINKNYTFMHMGEEARLVNFGEDNIVSFIWGGALPGHWGCVISLDGSNNHAHDDSSADTKILRVSDDIYFFYGD